MEEILEKLIEEHELNMIRYKQEKEERQYKMIFCNEHKLENELLFLRNQQNAINDIYYDYKKAIEDLRKILNDWNS